MREGAAEGVRCKISHEKGVKKPKVDVSYCEPGRYPGLGGMSHHQDHVKPLQSAHPTLGMLSEPGQLLTSAYFTRKTFAERLLGLKSIPPSGAPPSPSRGAD